MADVQVIGARELAASFARASRDVAHLDTAQSRTGAFIAQQAKMAAPRRTGALAASIRGDQSGNTVTVGSPLVYAGVIHFGSPRRHIAANPFVAVPAARTAATWSDYYTQNVAAVVGRIRGR